MITLDTIQSDLHSISIKDSGGDELAIDASGKITAIIEDGGGSITVDGAVDVSDGGGSLTVDAVQLDIDDLDHTVDSVKIGDGTDFLAINADGSINAQTVPGGFASWLVTQATVTTTESELVSTPLTGRLRILIQNLGANDVYLRQATGVTSGNGLELPKGSSFEADLDDGADVFAIAGAGTTDVRIVEYAA